MFCGDGLGRGALAEAHALHMAYESRTAHALLNCTKTARRLRVFSTMTGRSTYPYTKSQQTGTHESMQGRQGNATGGSHRLWSYGMILQSTVIHSVVARSALRTM